MVWQAFCYVLPCHHYPTPASQLNPALWSIQQQCAYTIVHTQHPGGFPPAGAIKGAGHRRCDCRAYSRGGSGRNRRENIWSMCRVRLSQTGVVTRLLYISTGCNFTGMYSCQPCFFTYRFQHYNLPVSYKIHSCRALGKLYHYICILRSSTVFVWECLLLWNSDRYLATYFWMPVFFFGSAWQIVAPWTNWRGRAPGISLTWPAFHKVRWLWSVSPCLMRWHFLGSKCCFKQTKDYLPWHFVTRFRTQGYQGRTEGFNAFSVLSNRTAVCMFHYQEWKNTKVF